MGRMLETLASIARNRTSYRVGLLQARAYRILKQETTDILKQFEISTIEWAFVGLLYEKKVMRMKDIADELGVEAPFVSAMASRLGKKHLLVEEKSEDSRVKLISLSPTGMKFVPETEHIVRESIRHLIKGVTPRDLIGYLAVLEAIISNEQ